MNKYLFKAKRKDNNEWIYGYLVIDKVGCSDNETSRDIYYIAGNSDNYVEVIPETICEYTGLNDKNGNMLFENDVILIGEKRRKVEVIFKDGQFGFLFNNTCVSFQYQNPKVIGNKFDEGDNNE